MQIWSPQLEVRFIFVDVPNDFLTFQSIEDLYFTECSSAYSGGVNVSRCCGFHVSHRSLWISSPCHLVLYCVIWFHCTCFEPNSMVLHSTRLDDILVWRLIHSPFAFLLFSPHGAHIVQWCGVVGGVIGSRCNHILSNLAVSTNPNQKILEAGRLQWLSQWFTRSENRVVTFRSMFFDSLST